MNRKQFKMPFSYSVCHGEGTFDIQTEDLREALHIHTDLSADGHRSVYIVDSDGCRVDEEYTEQIFINVRLTGEAASHPDDRYVAGLYHVTFDSEVRAHGGVLRVELAELALKIFDAHQGIERLPEFEIEVLDAFGGVLTPESDFDDFGPDYGHVQKIGEALLQSSQLKTTESLITKLGTARRESQALVSALTEVEACLDGLGVAESIDTIVGDNVDWVTRARYLTAVALGRRKPYPERESVALWVGDRYSKDFEASTPELREKWTQEYIALHP
ncbi:MULTISPECIES: hypothetical protein [Burkholderia cepacia complex]|uniref:Uncharacterized protein n=2 Tax=Burkholderia cepacia complex TaxID=87882 RepID=A0AAP1V7M8_9BURK|nr:MULTISPECIES: hypothetical protein [Burkholderia cepacia complex]MBK1901989.1 hypothetical protein [Burkholderia contaminans]MBK1910272.1 hypothetical protein [Burkholderia contaminans]MBK1923731.1 hypothetical protein [Burkholderia contaminans]MBK1931943.1 hypothetical protein [Burkholderia contaminans]MBK1939192.1 hypothetical protein [Burkholderia contaminans]